MYESPIKLIMGEMQTQFEDNCMRVVQSYGFDVDKNELVKALEYDRNQYEKGYADGKANAVVHGHWIFEQDEKMSWCTKATCSNCREVVADNVWISVDDAREEFISEKRYCERCGAKMDEVSE